MLKTSLLIIAFVTAAAVFAQGQDKPAANGRSVDIAPVVVTGTSTERLIQEAPVKTELFSSEDFATFRITSLRDALKLIPTARFENDCQNCGVTQIQLLGLNSEYTAILFDGAPLYSGLAKVYGADLFPVVFLDRIEVVKGGASVLYGPEAIAGVINLITAPPVQSGASGGLIVRSLRGSATEIESYGQGNFVSSDESGLRLSAYGLYQHREGLDLGTDGFTDIAEFESTIVGVRSWLQPLPDSTMRLGYQFTKQSHRGGDQLDQPEIVSRITESLEHDIHQMQLSWNQHLSDVTDYRIAGHYLYLERGSYYGARGDNEQRAFEEAGFEGDVTDAFIAANQPFIDEIARSVFGLSKNHVVYTEAQLNHEVGDHLLSTGVQFRYEHLTDGPRVVTPENPRTRDSFSNIGAFIQDQWKINEFWEIVPGVRVDRHTNVDNLIFSPRIATRYFATDEITARASWSTGFNAPGVFNEEKHIGVNNEGAIVLVNDTDLKEETSQTWSLGFEYVPAVFEHKIALHSQVHLTLLKDTFDIDSSGEVSGSDLVWLRVNGPDAQIFVWENNLNWAFHPNWSIDCGLSYVDARFDESVERVTDFSTRDFIKTPNWTGTVGLFYNDPGFLSAHVLASYTGRMWALGEESDIFRRTPTFIVVDAGVSRTFDRLLGNTDITVGLGIDNLFDQRQKDLQDNGEERDPTYLYGPARPRTYYVSLKAEW